MALADTAADALGQCRWDADDSQRNGLIAEVDLKWLLAGQGRWVDTALLHTNNSYAKQVLQDAIDSPLTPLHDCGVSLQRQMPD